MTSMTPAAVDNNQPSLPLAQLTWLNSQSELVRARWAYRRFLDFDAHDLAVPEAITAVYQCLYDKRLSPMPWLIINGPSGGGKTEAIRPFDDQPNSISVSTISENALMSGYRGSSGKDPSLMNHLDNRVLLIKDLTSMLSVREESLLKVMGELRDAYDGNAAKAGGTTGLVKYEARFGVIACCTSVIDRVLGRLQVLGERFLQVRVGDNALDPTNRRRKLAHIRRVQHRKHQWRKALTQLMAWNIPHLQANVRRPLPICPEPFAVRLEKAADLVSLFRTATYEDYMTEPEIASRLSEQLRNLTLARTMADRRTTVQNFDLDLTMRVARDTIPSHRRQLISVMYQHRINYPTGNGLTVAQLASVCRQYTQKMILSIIRQFAHLHMLEIHQSGQTTYYNLARWVMEDITDTQLLTAQVQPQTDPFGPP